MTELLLSCPKNTIRIVSGKDETILEGKEIFINTGSTPILPAIDGLKGEQVRIYQ